MKNKAFNKILSGDEGALKRALYKSMGFTKNQLEKPIIGIANSFTNATPGHYNLNELCKKVKEGIFSEGGTPIEFGTIAPCDGIAEGHQGMNYILPAREVIAASIEIMARAHKFDGIVLLGSCDKIVPAMIMAAARLGIPAIFVNGGPMMPANYNGKDWDGNIVTEAIGWKKNNLITEEEFEKIEDLAEPCIGSCAMMGTANTMCCIAEALGISLPGSAMIPAVESKRYRVAVESGEAIVNMVKKGISTKDILTEEAFDNALKLLLAMGGSTNAVLHLQAIYREAFGKDFSLEKIDNVAREIPQIASIYPASEYDVVDFHRAGGVSVILKELESKMNKKALTVTGETLGEILKRTSHCQNRDMIREINNPFSSESGIGILKGNLALNGAVAKPAAIPKNLKKFVGIARVFDCENDANKEILDGKITPGTAIVIRYEGPKGGPGMPEMYKPMKYLEGMGLSDSCGIITDGRFSGSNRGMFVGHISPEAIEGGIIAIVEDGDRVIVDISERKVQLDVKEEIIEERLSKLEKIHKDIPRGYLEIYRKLTSSAYKGAVL